MHNPKTRFTFASTIKKKVMTNHDTVLIHTLINTRGLREQAFKFACGKYGMKQCFHRGCEIFVPLQYALKGVDTQYASVVQMMHNGERQPSTDSYRFLQHASYMQLPLRPISMEMDS